VSWLVPSRSHFPCRYGYCNDGRFCGAFLPASSAWASVPNILGRPKLPVIVVDGG